MSGQSRSGGSASLPWIGRMPAGYITAELPSTAQRILVAAQHLLARDGYPGLTLGRIAQEAGEHKSLIVYHFDSKAGLLAALVDSLWHDVDVELFHTLAQLPARSPLRAEALADAQHELARLSEQYRMYFELLPACVRDTATRTRLAQLNGLYRELGVSCLAGTGLAPAELEPLASLLLAINDGVAVRLQLIPHAADDDASYGLLKRMLRGEAAATLADLSAPADASGGPAIAGETEPPVSAELAPVARNLVRGATRVLRRRGFAALTMENVAAEAGEPRSAITYYFGDKRGLVAAVLDDLLADGRRLCERRFGALAATPGDLDGLFALLRALIADRPRYRAFFELLPQILRDEELRGRQVAYERFLLARIGQQVGACRPDLAPLAGHLATLMLAAMDGLVLQMMLEPTSFDPAPAFAVLETLVARLTYA